MRSWTTEYISAGRCRMNGGTVGGVGRGGTRFPAQQEHHDFGLTMAGRHKRRRRAPQGRSSGYAASRIRWTRSVWPRAAAQCRAVQPAPRAIGLRARDQQFCDLNPLADHGAIERFTAACVDVGDPGLQQCLHPFDIPAGTSVDQPEVQLGVGGMAGRRIARAPALGAVAGPAFSAARERRPSPHIQNVVIISRISLKQAARRVMGPAPLTRV